MRQLLFIYNADSGLGHALLDALHKVVSPGTYACSLCGITYGATRMKPEWREFLQTLPVPARFLYRDQLADTYSALLSQPLPAVFWQDEAGRTTLLGSAQQLRNLDLPGLMALLRQRLALLAPEFRR
ncbi:hypothetical protein [Hymenobacter koreensis]|uniref:GTPase n=1 Tax=Hymenobacter koreensis TaxID=1084523 RepID=A0ABP8J618_9BACT